MLSGSSLQESEDWRRFRPGPWRIEGRDWASPSPPLILAPLPASGGQSTPYSSRSNGPNPAGWVSAYLGSGTGTPNHNTPPARGLGPERQAVPDLDVFLQDQAAAEGAFSLCAIPTGRE